MACDVSIIIPVLNKLEFTRQCLDRIARNTGEAISYEIIVIDNASTDGTAEWFASSRTRCPSQSCAVPAQHDQPRIRESQ